MNTVEDRLRDALREQARRSPIDPDAWRHVSERARPRPGRFGPRARIVVPVVAAAAVAAIVTAGVIIVPSAVTARRSVTAGTPENGGQTRPVSPAPPAAGGTGTVPSGARGTGTVPSGAGGKGTVPSGAGGKGTVPINIPLSELVPPDSAILGYHYTAAGQSVWAYFWLGQWSRARWFSFISPGLQLCSVTFGITGGRATNFGSARPVIPYPASEGLAGCQPMPLLHAGQLVQVTWGWDADHTTGITGPSMREGLAAVRVASVTAVLPDGRTVAGVVGTGRGFTSKVWSVAYPPGSVRLVFRDASGHVVASLTKPPDPSPPMPLPPARPASGGALVFRNPHATRPVAVYAYLIEGRVAFFASDGAAEGISPYPAEGAPAVGGLLVSAGLVQTGPRQFAAPDEYIGYAHADIVRVIVRIPGPSGVKQVATTTFPAGWSGSGIRLWAVQWPQNQTLGTGETTLTGYDAAGHAIATVPLGSQFP